MHSVVLLGSPGHLCSHSATSCLRKVVRAQAAATLTRSSVPHIQRASELPRRTVSSPAPPTPLVREAAVIFVHALDCELTPTSVALQAFELLQGNLVRFSSNSQSKDVPTAVLVHGILGSRRNLHSFARMIVEVREQNWFSYAPRH